MHMKIAHRVYDLYQPRYLRACRDFDSAALLSPGLRYGSTLGLPLLCAGRDTDRDRQATAVEMEMDQVGTEQDKKGRAHKSYHS